MVQKRPTATSWPSSQPYLYRKTICSASIGMPSMTFESSPSMRKFLWSCCSLERKQRLSVLTMPSISTSTHSSGRCLNLSCRSDGIRLPSRSSIESTLRAT